MLEAFREMVGCGGAVWQRVPLLSPWEIQRCNSLQVVHHKGIRKAPFSLVIDPEKLEPLLREFRFLWQAPIDLSQNAKVLIDVVSYEGVDGGHTLGTMETLEHWHPLLVRLYAGSFYQGYQERCLKGVSPDLAQRQMQDLIGLTLAHEGVHYLFQHVDMSLLLRTWIVVPEVASFKKSLIEQGVHWDDQEIACEYAAQVAVNNDSAWKEVGSFILNPGSRS